MRRLVYDPGKNGTRMTVVCFVSGSGTNYREIAARNKNHNYIVFTNRPDCQGAEIARQNQHQLIELSHIPYLKRARIRYGAGNVPRNCPERIKYEQDLSKMLEDSIGGYPDLICLAGYDQWMTDWIVDRYFPRILNIHPGDTTKGYFGLHWTPSARAILAGEIEVKSTLFFVDKGEDTGPVLMQSEPLNIRELVNHDPSRKPGELLDGLSEIIKFAGQHGIKTYEDFKEKADEKLSGIMESICVYLQGQLKVNGDWKIYPFGVHELISRGRVAIDGRMVFVDDREMPERGCEAPVV